MSLEKNLVVCPVYNEVKTIEAFLENLRKHYRGDVLFVDDGSSDRGKEALAKAEGPATFLLRHPRRRGYGQALLSGFDFALKQGYAKVVTLDADLQHNPKHIAAFLSGLRDYELVLGSRYIRIDRYFAVPRTRLVINRYICGVLKVLFSLTVTDAFCGYRGYRDSFLKKAVLTEQSYGLALEILLEAAEKQVSFTEIPIEAIYFNTPRRFQDGLDDPRLRLSYYLEVIARKQRKRNDEKEVLDSRAASGRR